MQSSTTDTAEFRTMAAYLGGILLALLAVAGSDQALRSQWEQATIAWRIMLLLGAAEYLLLALLPALFLGFTLRLAAPRAPIRFAPAVAFVVAVAATLLAVLLLLWMRQPLACLLVGCAFFLFPILLGFSLTEAPPPETACIRCDYDLRAHLASLRLPPRCPECGTAVARSPGPPG
jgi:hypothetical protein